MEKRADVQMGEIVVLVYSLSEEKNLERMTEKEKMELWRKNIREIMINKVKELESAFNESDFEKIKIILGFLLKRIDIFPKDQIPKLSDLSDRIRKKREDSKRKMAG
jgi:hypothetical protein